LRLYAEHCIKDSNLKFFIERVSSEKHKTKDLPRNTKKKFSKGSSSTIAEYICNIALKVESLDENSRGREVNSVGGLSSMPQPIESKAVWSKGTTKRVAPELLAFSSLQQQSERTTKQKKMFSCTSSIHSVPITQNSTPLIPKY
jgi:hypothetical protein